MELGKEMRLSAHDAKASSRLVGTQEWEDADALRLRW